MTNQRHLSILDEIKKSGGDLDIGKPNDSVMLIDGMNLFIRVFSAIPTTNEDGVHVGGIVGFLRSLAYTINMIRPTRTIIVFDGKGGCFLESGRDTASIIEVDMFTNQKPSTKLTESTSENLSKKINFEKERLSKWL